MKLPPINRGVLSGIPQIPPMSIGGAWIIMEVSLKEIVDNKKLSVENKKNKMPRGRLEELLTKLGPARDFRKAVSKNGRIKIIGEIKRASPSAGLIRKDFDVRNMACELARGGASAVSVLTDEKYFQGDLYSLITVNQAVGLPVLRKDFIIDEYQLLEARVFCADAVLLITSILSNAQLKQFLELCAKLGLAALVEVHSEDDLERALATGAEIIGVNNRDLGDFSVDANRIYRFRKQIPADRIVVCESGIKTREQVAKLEENGVDAALIGETLMRSDDIAGKLRELLRR
jgi:indole-3-glycerol phosphate synthase